MPAAGAAAVLVLALAGCPAESGEKEDPAPDSEAVSDSAVDTGDSSAPPPDRDGDGWVDEEDCAPDDATVNPAATESCNGLDDNCDGTVDEGVTTTLYADADGDGHGDPDGSRAGCPGEAGTSELGDDCDDAEPLASPGNVETCDNGVDDDCDGTSNDCAWSGRHEVGDVAAWIGAESYRDSAGESVSGAGDVDGDGLDDFLVGAPFFGKPEGEDGGTSPGAAYVVRGAASGFPSDLGGAWARLESELDPAGFGEVVEAAGDIDGDGLADILVGAPDERSSGDPDTYGGLYLFTGLAEGHATTADAALRIDGTEEFSSGAQAVASAPGDITGDGRPDLVLGAWNGDFRISVCDASTTGETGLDDCGTHIGQGSVDEGGYPTSAASDLDGDGVDDLLVMAASDCRNELGCASAADANGAVYLFAGPISGSLSWADRDAERVGEGVDDVYMAADGSSAVDLGDTDGDGYRDIAVGQTGWDSAHDSLDKLGAVYVIRGPIAGSASLSAADARIEGNATSGLVGACVAAPGDTDGDGRADLLFYGTASSGAYLAAVYLARGPLVSMDVSAADAEFYAGPEAGGPGSTCSSAGDVDGDGLGDMVLGDAAFYDPGYRDAPSGGLYVLLGQGM